MKMKALKLFLGFLWIFAALFYELPDRRFHIYFFDIGQGDSIFIKTPDNQQILIDGGPGNLVLEELGNVMPFFDRSLDLIVLTHPHADHMNGLIEVLNRYEVSAILMTDVGFEGEAYEEFLGLLPEVLIADSSKDMRFGEVYLDVLYPIDPASGRYFENVNNSSIAMKVTFRDLEILLTGDLEIEGEAELVRAYGDSLKADILKAGHHGSRTSSTVDFLAKVAPVTVVIQSGKDNSFGHPHPETLRKFKRMGIEDVRRNDLLGTVEFIVE